MKVQDSIDIAAPPEKIWPFLVEPERILKWYTLLQKFEYTSEQHSGVGTTFYMEEKAAVLMKLSFVDDRVGGEREACLPHDRGELRQGLRADMDIGAHSFREPVHPYGEGHDAVRTPGQRPRCVLPAPARKATSWRFWPSSKPWRRRRRAKAWRWPRRMMGQSLR